MVSFPLHYTTLHTILIHMHCDQAACQILLRMRTWNRFIFCSISLKICMTACFFGIIISTYVSVYLYTFFVGYLNLVTIAAQILWTLYELSTDCCGFYFWYIHFWIIFLLFITHAMKHNSYVRIHTNNIHLQKLNEWPLFQHHHTSAWNTVWNPFLFK